MPVTAINLVTALTAISGPQFVRSEQDIVTISPANTDEAAAVMKLANENSLTVTPFGGGTKQSWGNPVRPDIYLDLSRLNRVIEHPWQDLTCTVQAGCTWQHLQVALAKHNQFVALDPLWPERATVGGILATNDSGALRHKYGSLRDLVIGMTLVLADGTIARSGGKVVKNVAGYDLCKLLTGSLGTLAIITEATFRLHPLPQHAESFTVSAPQAAQLASLMASIRASHLLAQALQLRGDANGFHLDIQLNAHPEAHQNKILKQMTEAAGLRLESAPENVWTARETLFSNPGGIVLKATMLPSDVAAFAQEVEEKDGQSIAQSIGIMYASFPAGELSSRLVEEFRYHVGLQSGSTQLVSGAFPSDAGISALTAVAEKPDSLPLMHRVKKQFDPNNILNPGRAP